jgi:IS30 family transposase
MLVVETDCLKPLDCGISTIKDSKSTPVFSLFLRKSPVLPLKKAARAALLNVLEPFIPHLNRFVKGLLLRVHSILIVPGLSKMTPTCIHCTGMQGRPLTCIERAQIEFRLKAHCSVRHIGRDLQRKHRVIQYEIDQRSQPDGTYSAVFAQEQADRKRIKRKQRKRKLDLDEDLQRHVVSELEKGRSPDVIAGRLKIDPPSHLKGKTISQEAIYQWIQDGEGGYLNLHRHLCSGRPRRQKQKGRKARKTHIQERISIHERPKEIEDRKKIGDWESDSVAFTKQKERLSVQAERKARYVVIHRLSNGSAEETERALIQSIESFPSPVWQTITFDNGGEGATHWKLRQPFNIQTYFCDPYASWQKGSVENLNRIIRRYLPRTTDLSKITDQALYDIQETINNTPRKILGYKTPKEVMAEACG